MKTQSLKKNAIYNAIKTIGSIIFPFITFPYISRILQVENVGKINFGASIISFFSLIASLGISTYAIRECSRVKDNKSELSRVASEIYSINIITMILSYILLCFILISWKKLENYRLLIIIQSLSILFSTIGTDWINSAMEDFKFITIRTISFQILSVILMFLFVKCIDDYLKYAMISIVSSSGANIINCFYRKKFCDIHFVFSYDYKKHIIPIIYLFVMLLAQNIFHNVDIVMLGSFCDDKSVGIYASAHKIYYIISSFMASLLWVIMPRMSYYFSSQNYKLINDIYNKVFSFNIFIGLPIIVGMIMMSNELILIICGNEFIYSSSILRIFSIGFFFDLIGGMLIGNTLLLPSRKEKYFMFACCICALFNFILNYIFIPLYGGGGAAFTTGLSQLVLFLLLYIKKDKKIKIKGLLKKVSLPIIGCFLIIIICLLLKKITNIYYRTILSIFIATLSYFCIQVVFGNALAVEILTTLKNKIIKIKG